MRAAAAGIGDAPEGVLRLLCAGKPHTHAPPPTSTVYQPHSLETPLCNVASCSAMFAGVQEKDKIQIAQWECLAAFQGPAAAARIILTLVEPNI